MLRLVSVVSMNLSELRDAVRTQLDVDEDDLSNSTLDMYIREGYDRTIQLERRWPFFETSWSLVSSSGVIAVPSDLAGIASVIDLDENFRLIMLAPELAEDKFYGDIGGGYPSYFSWWGNVLSLYPSPVSDRSYSVRGWRKPTDWVAGGAASEVDADERLHLPLFHYACSLVYAQLEDPELENTYMRRWAATTEQAHEDIMRPQHHEPLVFNGGTRVPHHSNRFVWDL